MRHEYISRSMEKTSKDASVLHLKISISVIVVVKVFAETIRMTYVNLVMENWFPFEKMSLQTFV